MAPACFFAMGLPGALVSPTLMAQDDPSLQSVKQCAQIQEAAERYACYDRATASLRAGTFSGPATPAPATASSSQKLPANGPNATTLTAPTQIKPAEPGTEFAARIAAVGEHEPGQLMVTLENGQVWYQLDDRRYPLRDGMEVKIFPGMFGSSWRMAANELNGFIQVKRLK